MPSFVPRQVFDKDHSGAIDAEELQQLMFEFGMAVPESEVQAALRAIDADNSGEILLLARNPYKKVLD